MSAIYFANKYPDAKIIAIEPDADNFKFLTINSQPYSNIICLQKAVWPENTLMEVVNREKGNWALQTKVLEKGNDGIESVTIDELMNLFQIEEIDLLKIDIEGAEKELFSFGYENWLGATKNIAIELHDFLDPSVSPVFYNAIAPFNFSFFGQGENIICRK